MPGRGISRPSIPLQCSRMRSRRLPSCGFGTVPIRLNCARKPSRFKFKNHRCELPFVTPPARSSRKSGAKTPWRSMALHFAFGSPCRKTNTTLVWATRAARSIIANSLSLCGTRTRSGGRNPPILCTRPFLSLSRRARARPTDFSWTTPIAAASISARSFAAPTPSALTAAPSITTFFTGPVQNA